jgi:hypothetical protein
MLSVPILFLTYKREKTAQLVFDSIRAARPNKLYWASNAPKSNNTEEELQVQRVRAIKESIDWPCEIHLRFLDTHLPVKHSVHSAISWFFEHEERGIVLEDDCLPINDFYYFCEDLLEKYKDDERVAAITGNNFQGGIYRGDASYYFSKYSHIWGWATWRRSWLKNDLDISYLNQWVGTKNWAGLYNSKNEEKYWRLIFEKAYKQEVNTWDYSWLACIWFNSGVIATPNKNLVKNIGFGQDATSTKKDINKSANIESSSLGLIKHPEKITIDIEADKYVFENHYGGYRERLPQSAYFKLRRIIKSMLTSLFMEKNE